LAPVDRRPSVEVRAQGRHLQVLDYRCELGPADASFPERHDSYCVSIVREGTFCYHINDRTHLLEPGSVLLCNAGDEYTCSHEYGCGDVCTVFKYAPEFLDELGGERFDTDVLPPQPRLEAALGRRSSGEAWDEIATEVAELVLTGEGAQVDGPGSSRADRDRVHDAAAFLRENSADPLGLEDAARVAELSIWHFLRLFRRELGLTPHQYLIRLRILRAVRLLLDTNLPVTEVALSSGFGDLSNFTHTFRRQVGTTPGRFRSRR
jgi:AraC-like DNA-binding protein